MQDSTVDLTVLTRIVAEKCRIRNYKEFSELTQIIKDYSEDNQMPPEFVAQKLCLQWQNYRNNITRLKWAYGSPMALFRSHCWDSEDTWPWIRATPREPGVQDNPARVLTDVDN